MADLATAVRERLTEAVARRLARAPGVSVAYSGGLDSSIVASLAARHAPTDLVVVGVPGSPDLSAAREGAERLGLALTVRLVSPPALDGAVRRWAEQLSGVEGTMRAVAVATALALDAAPQPLVAFGQGADELFFGYAHYLGVGDDEARDRSEEDLRRLIERDWPLALRVARSLGHDLFSPFLDPGVIGAARAVPVSDHLHGGERKALLREVARQLGLPDEIRQRPKKAFQYGSGIDRELRRRTRLG